VLLLLTLPSSLSGGDEDPLNVSILSLGLDLSNACPQAVENKSTFECQQVQMFGLFIYENDASFHVERLRRRH
jgi:hypothetical protein